MNNNRFNRSEISPLHRGRCRWTPIAALLCIAVIMLAAAVSSACTSNGTSGSLEPILLGTYRHEGNALIYIAEDQGYFSRNGLDVTEQEYEPVAAAVKALLDGSVDIAMSSEGIFIGKIFTEQNICYTGTIDKGKVLYLVGLRNHGIEKVSDLKGKKIGVGKATNTEFFLGTFLSLNGISPQDVTLLDIKPSNIGALIDGSVDAMVVLSNAIDMIRERSDSEIVVFDVNNYRPSFWGVISRKDWEANHPQTLEKFFKSLAQAEEYLLHHPFEARAIVQKRMNYTDEIMTAVWSEHDFSLTLGESLIAAMGDEARWMINNNLTMEKEVPKFTDYICDDALRAIKPEAVDIIR